VSTTIFLSTTHPPPIFFYLDRQTTMRLPVMMHEWRRAVVAYRQSSTIDMRAGYRACGVWPTRESSHQVRENHRRSRSLSNRRNWHIEREQSMLQLRNGQALFAGDTFQYAATDVCTLGEPTPGRPFCFCVNEGICKGKVAIDQPHTGYDYPDD
jgi:hypothetical protein